MPVYDYHCDSDHWGEAFRSFGDRDNCPACETCGAATRRGWAIKPPAVVDDEGPVVKYRNGDLRAQWSLVDVVCECGHREREAVVERGATTAPCGECGAIATVAEHTGKKFLIGDELLKLYNTPGGHHDIGAGQTFTSKKDRAEWMKRNGWEEAGGSLDQTIDSMERKRSENLRRDEREWRETLDRYNHHPDFASYRKGRDEGQFKHANHRK
jgi:hypothetical protein